MEGICFKLNVENYNEKAGFYLKRKDYRLIQKNQNPDSVSQAFNMNVLCFGLATSFIPSLLQ